MEDDFKITSQELPAAIESILFVSGDPVSVDKLADICNVSKNAVNEALKSLVDRYAGNPWGGIEIQLDVNEGVIRAAKVYTDAMDETLAPRLEAALGGCPLRLPALQARLEAMETSQEQRQNLLSLLERSL